MSTPPPIPHVRQSKTLPQLLFSETDSAVTRFVPVPRSLAEHNRLFLHVQPRFFVNQAAGRLLQHLKRSVYIHDGQTLFVRFPQRVHVG